MLRRKAMSWRRVSKSLQALAAHAFLFCFTLLLVLKLDHVVYYSWWFILFPLWLFHAVVARGRFSLPASSVPHGRHWAPCHAVVATPLLIAFELLLCIYLESIDVNSYAALNLKIVFLPLLALEIVILIDNFRMCKALLPGDDEGVSDDAIWETLPHFWVAISMVFFVAATLFTLLKLCGDVNALGWWDLFINFSIAECFAFLVCTKWSNPVIHRNSHTRIASSSSTAMRYLDWNSGLVVSSEDQSQDRMCGLQDIGGHIMKVPIIGFQVLLCMRLEDKPAGAKYILLPVLFSPLFLLQGASVLFAASRLVEKIILLLRSGAGTGRYFALSSKVRECFGYLHHGSRFLGWWSIDEGSREEQACLFQDGTSGYNTFSGYPPEIVKKMPKKELAEEVWRLQAALGEQTEITKFSQLEYERLQNEKVLCRVCFEGEISVVLLPCRHRTLCGADEFLVSLSARGPGKFLSKRMRYNWLDLYRRFLKGQNFIPWFRRRGAVAEHDQQRLWRQARMKANIQHFISKMSELEIVESFNAIERNLLREMQSGKANSESAAAYQKLKGDLEAVFNVLPEDTKQSLLLNPQRAALLQRT